jgi:hypothetical protein
VQGHACGEGGREHKRCRGVWPQDSAPHEARSGVDVCTRVGIAALEACVFIHVTLETTMLPKRPTIYPSCGPPHQANHHTCGRGCLPGTLPLTLPDAMQVGALDEASLLDTPRAYMWLSEWLVALTYRVWLVCSALATVTGRWRGCTAQPLDYPLTHRGAHGCCQCT